MKKKNKKKQGDEAVVLAGEHVYSKGEAAFQRGLSPQPLLDKFESYPPG